MCVFCHDPDIGEETPRAASRDMQPTEYALSTHYGECEIRSIGVSSPWDAAFEAWEKEDADGEGVIFEDPDPAVMKGLARNLAERWFYRKERGEIPGAGG